MPLESIVYRKSQKFDTPFLQSEIGREIDRGGEGDISMPRLSVSGCLSHSKKFPKKLKNTLALSDNLLPSARYYFIWQETL